MRISEYIERLQQVQAVFGDDLQVMTPGLNGYGLDPVSFPVVAYCRKRRRNSAASSSSSFEEFSYGSGEPLTGWAMCLKTTY